MNRIPFTPAAVRGLATNAVAVTLGLALLAGCSADDKRQDPSPTAAASTQDVVYSYAQVGSNALEVAAPEDYSNVAFAYWIDASTLPGGGHPIVQYQLNTGTTSWVPALPNGEGAAHIASDTTGMLFVVSNTGSIYYLFSGTWVQLPGTASAIDATGSALSGGTNGGLVIAGPTGGFFTTVYKYNSSTNTFDSWGDVANLVTVAMDTFGRPFVVTKPFQDYNGYRVFYKQFINSPWADYEAPGLVARDFSYSDAGTVKLIPRKVGSADGFAVSVSLTPSPPMVGSWESQGIDAIQVDMGRNNRPWVVTGQGQVLRAQ